MGKIQTTFEIGKILRTGITRNNTLKKNQTSDNNKHNEQQAKNRLFSNDTWRSNDDNKTTTENKDNGLSEIPTNILSERRLLNNPKHRRTLIRKLKKNK